MLELLWVWWPGRLSRGPVGVQHGCHRRRPRPHSHHRRVQKLCIVDRPANLRHTWPFESCAREWAAAIVRDYRRHTLADSAARLHLLSIWGWHDNNTIILAESRKLAFVKKDASWKRPRTRLALRMPSPGEAEIWPSTVLQLNVIPHSVTGPTPWPLFMQLRLRFQTVPAQPALLFTFQFLDSVLCVMIAYDKYAI